MALCFPALCTPLDIKVAVKQLFILPGQDVSESAFDENEVKIMMKVKHNRIVHFYGAGRLVQSGRRFLVFEWMDGGSLYDVLQGSSPPNWKWKLKCLEDVAEGLNFLHAKKVVHRDIKSMNILIGGKDRRCKIADFGTTKFLKRGGKKLRSTNGDGLLSTSLGTPRWMAPEIFSRKGSAKVDVYSFGVLMYEVLTNKVPWEDLSDREVTIKTVNGERPKISSKDEVGIVPDGYMELMESCWSESENQRPSMKTVLKKVGKLCTTRKESMDLEISSVSEVGVTLPDRKRFSGKRQFNTSLF